MSLVYFKLVEFQMTLDFSTILWLVKTPGFFFLTYFFCLLCASVSSREKNQNRLPIMLWCEKDNRGNQTCLAPAGRIE